MTGKRRTRNGHRFSDTEPILKAMVRWLDAEPWLTTRELVSEAQFMYDLDDRDCRPGRWVWRMAQQADDRFIGRA